MSDLAFRSLFRSLRHQLMLSQSKMAEKLYVDHSYISRLESGERTPGREFLDTVCSTFELSDLMVTGLYNSAGFVDPINQRILEKIPPAFHAFMVTVSKSKDLGILLDEKIDVMGAMNILHSHIKMLNKFEENKQQSAPEDRLHQDQITSSEYRVT